MTSAEGRVFGIGLSRTGTRSLSDALNLLGIPTVHYPRDPRTLRQLSRADYRLSILEGYRGAADLSVAPFFPQLDRAYPGSKFVLTVRDLDAWTESVREHFRRVRDYGALDPDFRRFTEFVSAVAYGALRYDEARFRYAYRRHEREVREHFEDRPDDLLVMDICAGDGWEPLCSFLGLEVPSAPFPRSNTREEVRRWLAEIRGLRGDVERAIPEKTPCVILDDGLGLDRLLPQRPSRRLMERDGVHRGNPATARGAIRALERHRRDGARFLLIASPAFWWLDYYGDLRKHLERRHSRCFASERLLAFELRSEGEPDR